MARQTAVVELGAYASIFVSVVGPGPCVKAAAVLRCCVAGAVIIPDMSDAFPPDPLVCNGLALRKAVRRVGQLYDAVLAPSGLRASQRSLLVHVGRGRAPTLTALAQALVLDRSALARNLKPLEREGLVEVFVDAEDRRVRRVRLTSSGKARLARSHRLWQQAQARFEAAYGPERSAALRLALAELVTDAFSEAFVRSADRGLADASAPSVQTASAPSISTTPTS